MLKCDKGYGFLSSVTYLFCFSHFLFNSHVSNAQTSCEIPRQLFSQYCGKCVYITEKGLKQCKRSECRQKSSQGYMCLTSEGRFTSSSRLLAKQHACFDWFKKEWNPPSYVCPQMGINPYVSCTGACLETVKVSVMCTHHVQQSVHRFGSTQNLTLKNHEFDFARNSLTAYVDYCHSYGYDVSSDVEYPCVDTSIIHTNILQDYHVCRSYINSNLSSNSNSNSNSSSESTNPIHTFSSPALQESRCEFPYQLHARFCGRCIYRGNNHTLQVAENQSQSQGQNKNASAFGVERGKSFCCFDLKGRITCSKGWKESNGGKDDGDKNDENKNDEGKDDGDENKDKNDDGKGNEKDDKDSDKENKDNKQDNKEDNKNDNKDDDDDDDDKDEMNSKFDDSDVIYALSNLLIPNRKLKSLLCPFLSLGKNKMALPEHACSQVCIDSLRFIVAGIRAVMNRFQILPNDPILQFPATCLNDYIEYCLKLNSTVSFSLSCNDSNDDSDYSLSCPSLLMNSRPTLKSDNYGSNDSGSNNNHEMSNSSHSPHNSSSNHTFFPYMNEGNSSVNGSGITLGIITVFIFALLILGMYSYFMHRRKAKHDFHLVESEEETLVL